MSITIGTVILMPVDIAEVETISVAASATPVAAGTPDYDFVVTVTTSDYVVAALAANVSNTHEK